VVLALPRYIFPTQVIFWIFAGVTLAKLWEMVQSWRNNSTAGHTLDVPTQPA